MGSSKKHKRDKESRKRKHRSQSRSPISLSPEREKPRRHHKKHKKRERSYDVEEVPVDSHLSLSRSRHSETPVERGASPPSSSHHATSNQGDSSSLSINETNKLRAKLGLKPLQLTEEKDSDDGRIKDDLGEFYHKPALNISEKKKTEKIQAKLSERKEKRKIEERLLSGVRGLGSDSEDEAASSWVNKSRQVAAQKQEAAKRAAMLDELDAEFGIAALVDEEGREEKSSRYQSKQLSGLRVAHDIDQIGEDRMVVLTLQDQEVLADDSEDVLVNVNMVDDERYKKSNDNKRVGRLGYQAYTEEGESGASGLLGQYDSDDERQRGFVIGDEDALEAAAFRKRMVKEKLTSGRQLVSLNGPGLQIASDYLTDKEMTKFKKPKKKGRIRKRAKAEPIDVDNYDGNVPLNTDDTDFKVETPKGEPDDFEEEADRDTELEAALARARRFRLAEQQLTIPKVEEILTKVKKEIKTEEDEPISGVVLDSTAEFCRTLGDIPTYGLAGNRDHQDEIIDFELEEDIEADHSGDKRSGTSNGGGWNAVDTNSEPAPDIVTGGGALEAEPSLGAGVGGALRLALSKGYLGAGEAAGTAPLASGGARAHLLRAANYSIDDKAAEADERRRDRRDRRERCPINPQEFREKSNFKPDVKLDYVDDEGRPLAPKEAFRYLSHKFHGKGPGKNKKEKRIKKATQEGLMKQMSSTDTPLGTLALLRQRQEETRSPFVLLSGHKKMA